MSRVRKPEPVKLIMSLLSGDRELMSGTMGDLAAGAGPPDFVSEYIPFTYTDYYADEIGPFLERRLLSFETLIAPDRLPGIKIWTNDLEDGTALNGKRRINIDPGYLSAFHLILATGKGYAHRPYLRQGIYADLTLLYRDGAFHPLPWTYPDYREEWMHQMLMSIRRKYLLQRKETERSPVRDREGVTQ